MIWPHEPRRTDAARVVVTGMGVITALGIGRYANTHGFRAGRHAFRPVSVFDAKRQRTTSAAEITHALDLPHTRLSARQEARLDRGARMLLLATIEAWSQSGWSGTASPIPLVLGTTSAGMPLGEDFYRQASTGRPRARQQPVRVTHYQAQRQALNLMDALDFEGPVTVIANACASGANAVGHAFELIRSGRARRVLAGGYDALSQLVFAGFDALQALSRTRCRPFAADRDGLALGEGAAVFCLEAREDAARRGVEMLGEICGYGSGTDLHHLTQPNPDGSTALACMREACEQAHVEPGQVGYVNAHGTATPLNDAAEALAINAWAGNAAPGLPVSSTKASVGHLLGAAGAVEVAVCLLALQGQWLPPEVDVGAPDPVCRFPLVTEPRDHAFRIALTNSFGFGGANASLVLHR